jgi:hypothetical protein
VRDGILLVGYGREIGGCMRPFAQLTFEHEAMVDQIVQNPSITPHEMAVMFKTTPEKVRIVWRKPMFRKRVSERRNSLIDPSLSERLNDQVRNMTIKALKAINKRMDEDPSAEFAIEALTMIRETSKPIPLKAVKHNGNIRKMVK